MFLNIESTTKRALFVLLQNGQGSRPPRTPSLVARLFERRIDHKDRVLA